MLHCTVSFPWITFSDLNAVEPLLHNPYDGHLPKLRSKCLGIYLAFFVHTKILTQWPLLTVRVCLRVPTPSLSPSKFYNCANGNGPSDRQNGCGTHSARQMGCHHKHNDKLWRWRCLTCKDTLKERVHCLEVLRRHRYCTFLCTNCLLKTLYKYEQNKVRESPLQRNSFLSWLQGSPPFRAVRDKNGYPNFLSE